MRQNHGPLRVSETTLIIQPIIEGWDPQRVIVRNLLVERCGLSIDVATDCVRWLSCEQVVLLKAVLGGAQLPRVALEQFMVTVKGTDVAGA